MPVITRQQAEELCKNNGRNITLIADGGALVMLNGGMLSYNGNFFYEPAYTEQPWKIRWNKFKSIWRANKEETGRAAYNTLDLLKVIAGEHYEKWLNLMNRHRDILFINRYRRQQLKLLSIAKGLW